MIRFAIPGLVVLCALTAAQAQKIESAPAEAATPPPVSKKLPDKLEKLPPPEQPKRAPDEIIAVFFDSLKGDHVDAAYDTLKAEFAMGDRRDGESKGMRTQTQKALDAYGPVLGYELVREEKLGTHLMRRTYLLLGETLPLRWKFYFYKPSDRWVLIDLRIDDAIAEWFEDGKGTGH